MHARPAKTPNLGAKKVKHRLLASRSRIQRDGRALTKALESTPVPGQPAAEASAAIANLNRQLGQLHTDLVHQTGGGAKGKQARQLTAQTVPTPAAASPS